MDNQNPRRVSDFVSNRRFLYTVFFLSGISGLIYETVWLRVSSRTLGSTVQATSITISAFMFGLTLGSFYLTRATEKVQNKIKLYAKLEIGIALTAIITYLLFSQLVPVYRFFFDITGNNPILFRALQGLVLFVLMVIPTFFMGATLPVLSAGILDQGTGFTKTVGYLYGLNTLGAMFGVFVSAYITLGSIGEFNTVLLGTLFNLLAGTVFLLANKTNQPVADIDVKTDVPHESDFPSNTRNTVLFSYSFIGFISFALEVVWVRLFQLSLGTAIYAFSTVMIVYLGGSAIGSYTCSKFFGRLKSPVETLGFLYTGIGIFIITGLFLFSLTSPWYEASYKSINILTHYKTLITPLIIFPVTFSLGFIFPLVSRIYVHSKEKTGSGVGRLYAANTIGCILGALFCGYVFIPFIGTRNTMILLSAGACILGITVLFSGSKQVSGIFKYAFSTIVLAMLIVAIIFSPDPFLPSLEKYVTGHEHEQIWYNKEASDATITICGTNINDHNGKELYINGISMTFLCVETKIMAHLPLLLHPHPENMLVICYGMGTCIRSAVTHPEVNCDVVELIGEEYDCGSYFHSNAKEVLENKRVRHFTDDGRNFLLMHHKKYDVISIDPAPPIYSAGTVNLYSKDFFALCREKLTDNGILCLWIPPSSATEVKMIMKGYQSVFPDTYVYTGPNYKGFYMIGYKNYSPPDTARFDSAAKNMAIMNDLNEWKNTMFASPAQLLKLKILSPAQLSLILAGEKEVSDNYPYTEFPLWRKTFSPEYKIVLDGNNIFSK